MKAETLAKALRARGITVKRWAEGDMMQDGEVGVTDTVHVQVPWPTGRLSVVVQRGDSFVFRAEQPNVHALVADLLLAMQEERS